MQIRPIGSNMTELHTDTAFVLFSYSTPVAGSADGIGLFKTEESFSKTTTRHINKYFRDEWDVDPDTVQTIPQEQIDALVK